MADFPCPTCGKLNPAEAESCWFCTAALPGAASPAKPGEGGSLLNKLRSKAAETPAEDAPQGESSAPDWLARVRQKAQSDQGGLDAIIPQDDAEEEETPDWLEAIKSDSAPAPVPAPPAAAAPPPAPEIETGADIEESQAIPDWSGETQVSPQEADDTAEWLKSLEAAASPVNWQEPAQAEAQPVNEEEFAAPAEQLPEWMAGLGAESQPEVAPQPAKEVAAEPAAELPDWLAGLELPVETAQQAETALPDEPLAEAPETSAPPAEELPDWLAGMHAPAVAEVPTDAPAEAAPAAEIPDWISSRAIPAESEPAAAEPVSGLEGLEEELPDWMKDKQPAAEAEGDSSVGDWLDNFREPSAAEESAPAAELPDWMAAAPAASVTPAENLEESDWLAGFATAEAPAQSESAKTESEFWSGLGKAEPVPEPAVDVPAAQLNADFDPLAEFSEETSWKEGSADAPDLTEFGAAATTAAGIGALTAENAKETPVSPFTAADLPDWLAGMPRPAETSEEGEAAALAPADLPEWLQAMRPVGSIAAPPEDREGEVASSGPLAGMEGVLPGEKFVLSYGKPPVYSARLKVSERQQVQANILETMLAQLRRPQPVQEKQTALALRLGRMAVGLILLAMVIIMTILPGSLFAPATSIPPAAAAFHNQLEALPAGGTVLLVVDFDAAFAGELPLAARPALERLMARKMRLVVVSTSPSGLALADQMLAQAAAVSPGFNPNTNVIRLGYLPGGATGARHFAEAPRSLSGTDDPWLSPALSGITRLQDFSAVLLLSDSLEGAQMWIEQTSGKLGSAPLLAVTSAQAAPVLNAYYRSGQLVGMLEGIPAAAAYGTLIGKPVASAAWWSVYQAGLLVLLAAVVLGGLWQIISRLTRKKAS